MGQNGDRDKGKANATAKEERYGGRRAGGGGCWPCRECGVLVWDKDLHDKMHDDRG